MDFSNSLHLVGEYLPSVEKIGPIAPVLCMTNPSIQGQHMV